VKFSREEVDREIGKIVEKFSILECDKCARAVITWLDENGIEGKLLKLRTRNPREFYIVSDRLNPEQSITNNGVHYGVEVEGRVFDNLSTSGMSRLNWINDFHCPSEQFIIEELEEL